MGDFKEPLPICVDLDGTLIYSDVTTIAAKKYVRRNILHAFSLLGWICRGIAYFKHRLAEVEKIDPVVLPYNHDFLDYIKRKKVQNHKIFLATACDAMYARAVVDYLDIFDGFFASDGKTNLRGKQKADRLKSIFGQDFIYAGNSVYDIPVWNICAESIVVTPTSGALRGMRGKKYRLFS